jgi:hypothetical protein
VAERGEFELPVPISEQSDYKKMSRFAAPRRIIGAHEAQQGVAIARRAVPKLSTGTGSSNSILSAIESFSVCNSARDNRNTRLRGRFRTAGGSGERSEPGIPPICGLFSPQQPLSPDLVQP